MLHLQGKTAEAHREYEQALAEYRNSFPRDDPNIANALLTGGVLARNSEMDVRGHASAANYAEAEPLFREATAIQRNADPPQRAAWAECAFNLGDALLNLEKYEEAVQAFREAVNQLRLEPQRVQSTAALFHWELALALMSRGQMADASEELLEARRLMDNGRYAWREDMTITTLYSIWNQREPGKGYDMKSKEWESIMIQNSPFFRAALSAPSHPTTTQPAGK